MPKQIALLRAINVGGRNLIAMAELRQLFESLGFTGVKSLLQSGNLVFESSEKSDAALERRLEAESEKRFGVAADYVVRTAREWDKIIAGNPFPKEAKADPGHLLLICLKSEPDPKNVKALQAAIRGPEYVQAVGKQLFAVYPAGIGKSKLTINLIEKTLGTRGTGRNWNTVLKLGAMVNE
jgi:uncharacterized protein (DUF1697 family)